MIRSFCYCPVRARRRFRDFALAAFVLFGWCATAAAEPPGVPTSWQSRGIGGGGAVYLTSISPWNENEIWLTCDMGDMFRSLDFGATWSTIPSATLVSGKHSAVRFTDDPAILYTLHNNGGGAYYPVKSTDGGDHWISIANPSQGARAFALFADPGNHLRLVLADQFRLYFSTDGGASFGPAFYSDNAAKGLHLAGVFFDGLDIYVATNKGLLVSHDGGASFPSAVENIAGIDLTQEEIAGFAGSRQGGAVKCVCTTLAPASVTPQMIGYAVTNFRNVYSWRPGQASWSSIKSALPAPTVDKVLFVEMVSADTSTIYLAGQTTVVVAGTHDVHTVFKSTDGGGHFTNVFLDSAGVATNQDIATGWLGTGTTNHNWFAVSQPLGLAVDPHDVNRLILTNSSGPHVSTDGGATWRQGFVNLSDSNPPGSVIDPARAYRTSGLETTVCYWLTWDSPTNLLASFADLLLVRSQDAGSSWSFNYAGFQNGTRVNDLSMILRHPITGELYAAAGEVVGSAGNWSDGATDPAVFRGYVARSTDHGQNWQVIHDFQRLVSSIAFDPTNPSRMYATVMNRAGPGVGGGVYVCQNIGLGAASVWDSLPHPARTQGRAARIQVLSHGELVATYTGRTNSANTFVDSSGVFLSVNGGQTWSERTDPGMRQFTSDLVVDPNDSTDSTWFACVRKVPTAPSAAGLYRSTVRGSAWSKVFGLPVISCTIHPTRPDEMFVCTEFDGLWYVTGARDAFPVFTQLTAYPFRRPTRVFFNPHDPTQVWVSSEGNGMRLGLVPQILTVDERTPDTRDLRLASPNPVRSPAVLEYTLPNAAHVSLVVSDVTGRTVAVLAQGERPAGTHRATWQPDRAAPGLYFVHLDNSGRHSTLKLVVTQ